MPYFYKKSAVQQENPNAARRIVQTPEDIAIGDVPGKVVWFDAENIDQDAGVIQNRARTNRFMEMPFVGAMGALPFGITAISASDLDPLAIRPEEAINPNEWSVMFVIKPVFDEVRQVLMNSRTTTDDIAPHIGLSSTGNTIYVYGTGGYDLGQPQRISYTGNFPDRAGPSLITVTFSTKEGLHIYDGRTLVATAAADKDPLEASFGAGQWEMMRFVRGLIGMGAVFSIDLHRVAYKDDFKALQDWLIDKYKVTLP